MRNVKLRKIIGWILVFVPLLLVTVGERYFPTDIKIIFRIVITIIVYHISFNIFYLVDVVENCIKLYKIKQTYGRIVDNNLKGEANEIRIDFILAILMNLCDSSQEQLCDELIKYVKKTATEEEAKKLINYFTERYK